MKNIVQRLSLNTFYLLVLGGCISIVIAVLGAVIITPTFDADGARKLTPREFSYWNSRAPLNVNFSGGHVLPFKGFGHDRFYICAGLNCSQGSLVVLEAGFPLKCLSGTAWKDGAQNITKEVNLVRISLSNLIDELIPIKLRMRPLLINSVVLGLLTQLLIMFTVRIRGWLRSARGRCLICGYDLRYSRCGCPECGWNRL